MLDTRIYALYSSFLKIGLGVVFGVLIGYATKFIRQSKKRESRVIIFPDSRIPCKELLKYIKKWEDVGYNVIDDLWARTESRLLSVSCPNPHCKFYHSMDSPYAQLLLLMTSANKTLDICMYSFSERHFADVVRYLHKVKSVKVRIITDEVQETGENSCINFLFEEGISVIFENRYPRSTYFMHHKFFIVDDHILMVGSLNLTRTALVGNNESVICTSDQSIVTPFKQEFNKLWSSGLYDRCPVGGKNYRPI